MRGVLTSMTSQTTGGHIDIVVVGKSLSTIITLCPASCLYLRRINLLHSFEQNFISETCR